MCAQSDVSQWSGGVSAFQSLLLGSALAVSSPSVDQAYHSSCRVKLTPYMRTVSRRLQFKFHLTSTGRFMLQGACPSASIHASLQPCTYRRFENFVLACRTDQLQVGLQCEERRSGCPNGFTLHLGRCFQIPLLLALQSFSRDQSVVIEAPKSSRARMASTEILIQLAKGDFDVSWEVACAPQGWLQCGQTTGRLSRKHNTGGDSAPSVATLPLLAMSRSYPDSTVAAEPSAIIRFSARVLGSDSNLSFSGQSEQMRVIMRVTAEPDLNRSTLRVSSDADGNAHSFRVKELVYVTLRCDDFEGLPIHRDQNVYVRVLSTLQGRRSLGDPPASTDKSSNPAVRMLYDAMRQEHRVVLPGKLFPYENRYHLHISLGESASSASEERFQEIEVLESSNVQLAVGVFIACALVVLLLIMAFLVSKHPQHARRILFSFFKFELMLALDCGMEIWDFASGKLPCSVPCRSCTAATFLMVWFCRRPVHVFRRDRQPGW